MSDKTMPGKKSSSTRSTSDKAFDFEASLAKLENLVDRMEEGEMSLEESLKAFEEGVKLTRLCQETLSNAQQKVQLLMEQQGKVSLKDMSFNNDESDDEDDDRDA